MPFPLKDLYLISIVSCCGTPTSTSKAGTPPGTMHSHKNMPMLVRDTQPYPTPADKYP